MKHLLTIVFIGLVFGGYGQLTDKRDGKVYETVIIGEQEWMAENLAYKPDSGEYLAYDNDTSNVVKYGYLYDWETAKNVCPTSWHLPSKSEWNILLDYLGGKEVAGIKMRSTSSWYLDSNGTNESGFNALPGGYGAKSRRAAKPTVYIGIYSSWWTSSEASIIDAIHFLTGYYSGRVTEYYNNKSMKLYLRCIKD